MPYWEGHFLQNVYYENNSVMHQSFVTTAPPTYGDGLGIVGLMCGAVTFGIPLQY